MDTLRSTAPSQSGVPRSRNCFWGKDLGWINVSTRHFYSSLVAYNLELPLAYSDASGQHCVAATQHPPSRAKSEFNVAREEARSRKLAIATVATCSYRRRGATGTDRRSAIN